MFAFICRFKKMSLAIFLLFWKHVLLSKGSMYPDMHKRPKPDGFE